MEEQSLRAQTGLFGVASKRYHEIKRASESKVKSTISRLVTVLFLTVIFSVAVLMLLSPRFGQFLTDSAAVTPLATKVMLIASYFLVKWWLLIVLSAVILTIVFRIIFKISGVRKLLDRCLLKSPLAVILRKINVICTVKTLGFLMREGVKPQEAVQIISKMTGDIYYKEALVKIGKMVGSGGRLSAALRNHSNLFPLTVWQMVEAGEEMGQVPGVLEKLGDLLDKDLPQDSKNMARVVEPVVMLVIGSIAGFLLASFIQPLIPLVF
jgi:type IV pilus assembly protein PilC